MSSIRHALEKLDNAVGRLDLSLTNVENSLQSQLSETSDNRNGHVVDVDFVARRLDRAIASVETLLQEGE